MTMHYVMLHYVMISYIFLALFIQLVNYCYCWNPHNLSLLWTKLLTQSCPTHRLLDGFVETGPQENYYPPYKIRLD